MLKEINDKFKAGRIESYVHNGRIAALVDVRCNTDFVANTDEFKQLCKELAMQASVGIEEHFPDQCWIKDSSKKIYDLISEYSKMLSEEICVARYERWSLQDE